MHITEKKDKETIVSLPVHILFSISDHVELVKIHESFIVFKFRPISDSSSNLGLMIYDHRAETVKKVRKMGFIKNDAETKMIKKIFQEAKIAVAHVVRKVKEDKEIYYVNLYSHEGLQPEHFLNLGSHRTTSDTLRDNLSEAENVKWFWEREDYSFVSGQKAIVFAALYSELTALFKRK